MRSESISSKLSTRPVRAFLSFTTTDRPVVEGFRRYLLTRFKNLELLDHAVVDLYDKNWKLECARKIDRSTVLFCLVGSTTYRSEAVAWEIDRGLSHGLRVIAFTISDRHVRLPEALVRNSILPIPYNAMQETPISADLEFEAALNATF